MGGRGKKSEPVDLGYWQYNKWYFHDARNAAYYEAVMKNRTRWEVANNMAHGLYVIGLVCWMAAWLSGNDPSDQITQGAAKDFISSYLQRNPTDHEVEQFYHNQYP